MDNRFNELDLIQQKIVSTLINALAANSHVRTATSDLIMYDAINKIHDAGREAMTLEDVQ